MQSAKFNAVFTDRREAEGFESWVTERDGAHVTEPLMEADQQYCGAKVRSDSRIVESYQCPIEPSSDGHSELSDSASSPRGSPKDSEGGANSPKQTAYPYDSPSYGGASYSPSTASYPMSADEQWASSQQRGATMAATVADLPWSSPAQQSAPWEFSSTTAFSTVPGCRTRFQVQWSVQLLPGQLASVEVSSTHGALEHWTYAADSNFYLRTNVLLRQMAAELFPGRSQPPDSNDIALSSVQHSIGSIDGTPCGVGIRKLVTYRLVFDAMEDAVAFRRAMDSGEANLFRRLRAEDSAGVCGGSGSTDAAKAVWMCPPSSINSNDHQAIRFNFAG